MALALVQLNKFNSDRRREHRLIIVYYSSEIPLVCLDNLLHTSCATMSPSQWVCI